MQSFYGGNPGFSFIIVIEYDSIDTMINNFKKGPDYTAVHYDEHVIINTENKNDPDNGKIFRRGYNYLNELGGAIYIGTIVGPAGRAPMLELATIEEVNNKQAQEGYDYRKGSGSYAPTENLIPGKEEDGKFNDEIEWAYCSIRNENDSDSTAYIGFKFPYLVMDFEAQSVDPYYNRNNQTEDFINQNLINRIDDKTHPFYEKWSIKVPKGIKGDALKNLRVIEANDNVEDYDGKENDIASNRKIVVYDYFNYNKQESGEPVTLFLGDYNIIEDVSINEEGTITFYYTHEDDKVFNKLFKWIKSISLDANTGEFVVNYNYENDNSGTPTKYTTHLDWIKEVSLEDDGTLKFKHTTNSDTVFNKTIRWIDNIVLNQDGSVVITYNTGETKVLERALKFIASTFIETEKDSQEEGTGDQKLHIIYNTGEEEIIGKPINYILETAISKSDYHYLVRYSDPKKRQSIIDSGESYTYNGKNDWHDLGSIKDDSGILVGLNISKQEHPDLTDHVRVINYLNLNYPNGLQGTDLLGKVVSFGDAEDEKKFYAFDYNKSDGRYLGWYYLGSFNAVVDNSKIIMINKETDSDFSTNTRNLDIGGIWFVVEE